MSRGLPLVLIVIFPAFTTKSSSFCPRSCALRISPSRSILGSPLNPLILLGQETFVLQILAHHILRDFATLVLVYLWPGGPDLHCTVPTEGAPSLRFLQRVGGEALRTSRWTALQAPSIAH